MARPEGDLPRGRWVFAEDDRFLSFDLRPIADEPIPDVPMDVVSMIESTSAAIAGLEGRMRETSGWAIHALTELLESTISSQIEGTSATPADVMMHQDGQPVEDGTAAVAARNREVVRHLLDLDRWATSDDIERLHGILFPESAGAGRYRAGPVWLGPGDYPDAARYVGPHPTRVNGLMEDLIRFIEDPGLPAVLRTVIAHGQFEMIHPFGDGNGRIGRALMIHHLHRSGTISQATLLVSKTIRRRQSEYNAALQSLGEGSDWLDWCRFMLPMLQRSAEATSALMTSLGNLHGTMEMRLYEKGAPANDHRFLDLLIGNPWLNSRIVRSELEVTGPTANRLLRSFESEGWLVKVDDRARSPFHKLVAIDDILADE